MKTLLILMVGQIAMGHVTASHVDDSKQQAPDKVISTPEQERIRVLSDLVTRHAAVRERVLRELSEAVKQHAADRRHYSPLHCAILAAEKCEVLEADAILLQVPGYSLKMDSVPEGALIGGTALFPAASALVTLKVDIPKVLDAIKASKNDSDIRVLTWILVQRAKSLDEARWILDRDSKQRENEKIAIALKYLDLGDNLLPSPHEHQPDILKKL